MHSKIYHTAVPFVLIALSYTTPQSTAEFVHVETTECGPMWPAILTNGKRELRRTQTHKCADTITGEAYTYHVLRRHEFGVTSKAIPGDKTEEASYCRILGASTTFVSADTDLAKWCLLSNISLISGPVYTTLSGNRCFDGTHGVVSCEDGQGPDVSPNIFCQGSHTMSQKLSPTSPTQTAARDSVTNPERTTPSQAHGPDYRYRHTSIVAVHAESTATTLSPNSDQASANSRGASSDTNPALYAVPMAVIGAIGLALFLKHRHDKPSPSGPRVEPHQNTTFPNPSYVPSAFSGTTENKKEAEYDCVPGPISPNKDEPLYYEGTDNVSISSLEENAYQYDIAMEGTNVPVYDTASPNLEEPVYDTVSSGNEYVLPAALANGATYSSVDKNRPASEL